MLLPTTAILPDMIFWFLPLQAADGAFGLDRFRGIEMPQARIETRRVRQAP
jgi:hypothetical protein